jgi:hypothetical protein
MQKVAGVEPTTFVLFQVKNDVWMFFGVARLFGRFVRVSAWLLCPLIR